MSDSRRILMTLAGAAALLSANAYAQLNWVGTANYTAAPGAQGDEDAAVGPFDTYDFGTGVVLVKPTGVVGSNTLATGYYQSYVTGHQLGGLSGGSVPAPNLSAGNYELTITSTFFETVNTATNQVSVTGGNVALHLDTSVDRNFNTDSGFGDGTAILNGTIIGGNGGFFQFGGQTLGVTDLRVRIDSFNPSVFEPDTIYEGSSVFTLRLGSPFDAAFLNPINSVLGVAIGPDGLKFAADGYITLAVPEASSSLMMLAGLALVGFVVARRNKVFHFV